MQFEGLDLNLLVVLDALLTEQSVTRAASRLFVTQPGVSVALQKLRVRFSDQLLVRVGNRMELTPFAQGLALPLKELLHQIRTLVESRSAFDPQVDSRMFRLLMSSSVAEIFGVPALRKLRDIAPNVHCQIDVFVGPDMLRLLQDGEIDLSIQQFQAGVWDPIADMDSLSHQAIFSDYYVLVGDASNSLLIDNVDFDRFCRMDHIETRFRGRGNLTSLPERSLGNMPARPKTTLIVPTYKLAIEAVLGSPMTAIVPNRVARDPAYHGKLAIVDPPFKIPRLEHSVIWHKRNENDDGYVWFRNFLLEFAAEHM